MKRKPILGETLYSLEAGNAARGNKSPKLTPVKVVKVGRKFFDCEGSEGSYTNKTYHLDTWYQKTDYLANSQLFETIQEHMDQKERAELIFNIRWCFNSGSNVTEQISLENLRKISALGKLPQFNSA